VTVVVVGIRIIDHDIDRRRLAININTTIGVVGIAANFQFSITGHCTIGELSISTVSVVVVWQLLITFEFEQTISFV
jgi:hypothetical protein